MTEPAVVPPQETPPSKPPVTPPNDPAPTPNPPAPTTPSLSENAVSEITARVRAEFEAEREKQKSVENGEYKKLWETSEEKLRELTPLKGKAEKYAAMIHEVIDSQIEKWPDEVKALDPGKDVDVELRKIWVEKSKALAARLSTSPPNIEAGVRDTENKAPGTPGSGKNPVESYLSSRYARKVEA